MIFRRAPSSLRCFLYLAWVGMLQSAYAQSGPGIRRTVPGGPGLPAYYDYHGGAERLGKAISPPRKEGSATIQFLETGKMVFDTNARAIVNSAWRRSAGNGCQRASNSAAF